ncbi:FecR domain-containing protein [Phenylobacterium sp. SCN 70-31]|uniref:FecR domain-containing protein n=1 Tax=Phenylobacterium sp. SCN 70-31 TaxID=1660129 RepID=UPI000AD93108|nr:FecR domain-containing protein [Phenylobacterium sp. SCN 70-31]
MIVRTAFAGLVLAVALATSAQARQEPVLIYVVERGDTLYDLGQRGLTRPADHRVVQRLNRIADPRRLRPGSRLRIPERLLRTEAIEARLGAFKGEVSLTSGDRTVPAAKGLAVREGDGLATGANAFGRLDLPDGSRVTLPSQSRVRIVRLRRTLLTGGVQREFLVEAGGGASLVRPLRGPHDSYIVRTPMSVSAVRGTEFRVRFSDDGRRAATEVLEGSVEVSTGGDVETVAPAFARVSTVDGPALTAPLPPPPALRRSDGLQDQPVLSFDVEPAANVRGYRAQIASDAGFVDVLADAEATQPRLTFDAVADGVYFVRATVVDAQGLEGMPVVQAFERRLNTLTPRAPTQERGDGLRRFLFRWDVEGDGERSYRFQIRREGQDALPLIDQAGLTETSIALTDLPPGTYVWRVMSRTFVRGRYVEKWSAEQRFETAL